MKIKVLSKLFLVALAIPALNIGTLECKALTASDSRAQMDSIEARLNKNEKPSESDFETLGDIVSREPQNTRARLILGLAYEHVGLGKQAVEQYVEAVKLSPNDPKPLVDLATARIRYKDSENISGLIATGVAKFPNDPEILFLKGYDAMKHNKFYQADAAFKKAYAMKPNIPWLRPYYAELKLNQGAAPMALYLAKQDIAENPKPKPLDPNVPASRQPKPNAWYPKDYEVAGLALIQLQHYAEAVDYLAVACDNDITRADLNEKLGTLAAWSGRYRSAVTPTLLCLAESVNAYNDHQKLCNILADCLRKSNKASVLKDLDEIVQKYEPAATNGYFHTAVGEVFDRVGWHDAAMARFEFAIKIFQQHPTKDGRAYFDLARDTELYTQDYQKALVLYRQAQQLSLPQDVHISDYVSRLEDRMAMRKQDVAWRLKDLLSRRSP